MALIRMAREPNARTGDRAVSSTNPAEKPQVVEELSAGSQQAAAPGSEPASVPATAQESPVVASRRLRSQLDAQIARDMQEALQHMSGEALLESPSGLPGGTSASRATCRGRVVAVHGDDVFVDIGARSQGVLSRSQFPEGVPAPGTEVEVLVEGYDEREGLVRLQRQGAVVEADWSKLAPGVIVEARVTAVSKGGLVADVQGIRAFIPLSQIDLYRVEDPQTYINQRLRCQVLEAVPAQNNLVLSRRAVLEKERAEQQAKLWSELAEGQVREGTVRALREFGAFVDLGGIEGLLPLSEMAWTRTEKPDALVQVGQKLHVMILKVDRERRRLTLGLKQLTASPWERVEARYPPNGIVTGRVTRLVDFGAFVELEPGLEGLIHISELAHQRVRRPADVVRVGQEVQVRILRVDPAQRRIALSLKSARQEPDRVPAEEPAPEKERKKRRGPERPLKGGLDK